MLAHSFETRTLILVHQRCSHCHGTLWLEDDEWKCSLCGRAWQQRVVQKLAAPVTPGNSLDLFIRECCVSAPGAAVPSSKLYTVYADWCLRRQLVPLGRIAFARAIQGSGYRRHRTRLARYWDGLRCLLIEDRSPAGRSKAPALPA